MSLINLKIEATKKRHLYGLVTVQTSLISVQLEYLIRSCSRSLFSTCIIYSKKKYGGWGGRDRTYEWGLQRTLPYRLATPQNARIMNFESGIIASESAFMIRYSCFLHQCAAEEIHRLAHKRAYDSFVRCVHLSGFWRGCGFEHDSDFCFGLQNGIKGRLQCQS